MYRISAGNLSVLSLYAITRLFSHRHKIHMELDSYRRTKESLPCQALLPLN